MMPNEDAIRRTVRDHYKQLAQTGSECGSCCSANTTPSGEEPLEARQVCAGCGSPVEAAGIKQGEVVVDLGSGGGFDAFRASKLVGESGQVIGVDATPEMVWRARETAKKYQFSNVEFRLGEIEHVPVDSALVDAVISNCVVNLAPDKGAVFREAFRILKPGGRLVISDVVTEGAHKVDHSDLNAWAECVAGAIPKDEYIDFIKKAGFVEVQVKRNNIEQKETQSCCSSEIDSLTITAAKPKGTS